MFTMPRAALALISAVALAVAACQANGSIPRPPTSAATAAATGRLVERACAVEEEHLVRVWRGFHPRHSEDIVTIPREPNFAGTFTMPSHTGPWDYLQRVPLVFYGPERIPATGPVDRPVSIVDVYPTIGEMLGVPLKPRKGVTLGEVAGSEGASGGAPPKLVVTIVWDGAGRNVLERWPDAWPTLARLERDGASYTDATIGSSPSITPSIHANLGTGTWPNEHEVTGIQYRADDGEVRTAFAGMSPTDLRKSTFADQIDARLGNEPKVGLVGWREWHLGMLGHGTASPDGDADEVAVIRYGGGVKGNPDYYSTPPGLADKTALRRLADKWDRADGLADGLWMGHDLLGRASDEGNPAWLNYETKVLLDLLRTSDYGQDAIPDLLLVNYKQVDIAGHQYTMDAPETEVILRAQDRDLARLLRYLDDEVGDYVVVVTADHGSTPSPERSQAWPISLAELGRDLDRRFETDGLVVRSNPVGLYLDPAAAADGGATPAAIATFLNRYTLGDNWAEGDLPDAYGGRADEQIFEATFPATAMDDVMTCAFGRPDPE